MPKDLPPAQLDQLESFESLLRDRAVSLGLIAASDMERLGERHVHDSLRAASLILSGDEALCDIGPGAGLPGLVLAIAKPDLEVTLLEPKQRAVAFLELAVSRLHLGNVEILPTRVEEVEMSVDVATTRAFGPMERSWEAALRVLRPGGRLIYFAGEGLVDPAAAAGEMDSAEAPASVDVERVIADFSPLVIMTRATL